MTVKGELEIDALIRQNSAFAVYRLPHENRLHFVIGQPRIIPEIVSLSNQNGFVIAPFLASQANPIVMIEADEEFTIEPQEFIFDSGDRDIRQEPVSAYRSRFGLFTKALIEKEFLKLVLSHRMEIPRGNRFSPEKVFYRAFRRYIRSYVYLFHTPQTGTWIGSTPEILLSGKGNNWHTVALAGTQQILHGQLPEMWTERKREEQQLVTDYIRNCLLLFNIVPEEEGPYAVQAGELAHLRTDFRFSLNSNQSTGELLNALHPTPAVCGLPKTKACEFITENEGYDRRYYSGFLGRISRERHADLYVNLRCMQIEDSRLLLYAGGGLLASSDLREEWMEIEDKLLTMFRII